MDRCSICHNSPLELEKFNEILNIRIPILYQECTPLHRVMFHDCSACLEIILINYKNDDEDFPTLTQVRDFTAIIVGVGVSAVSCVKTLCPYLDISEILNNNGVYNAIKISITEDNFEIFEYLLDFVWSRIKDQNDEVHPKINECCSNSISLILFSNRLYFLHKMMDFFLKVQPKIQLQCITLETSIFKISDHFECFKYYFQEINRLNTKIETLWYFSNEQSLVPFRCSSEELLNRLSTDRSIDKRGYLIHNHTKMTFLKQNLCLSVSKPAKR